MRSWDGGPTHASQPQDAAPPTLPSAQIVDAPDRPEAGPHAAQSQLPLHAIVNLTRRSGLRATADTMPRTHWSAGYRSRSSANPIA